MFIAYLGEKFAR